MAVIDIGSPAIERDQYGGFGTTRIDTNNPANATGILTKFELWYDTNATGVKVGTFYGSGTSYTSRDYEVIGDVVSGSKQTFAGMQCDVTVGDYIGNHATSGGIERHYVGYAGIYYLLGDQFGAGQQVYTFAAEDALSAYGEGVLPYDIDIGLPAIDRATNWTSVATYIGLDNSANDDGTLTKFEIWSYSTMTGCKAGTFYGSGTDYTNRDYETIGDVPNGSKQTFTGLDCDVIAGDYVGLHFDSGGIEQDSSGFAGVYFKAEDQFDTGLQTYSLQAGNGMSVYGAGAAAAVGQNYDRSAIVLVGSLASASRLLAIDRDASILIGNLVSAFKSWNVPKASSVLIGNLVSASGIPGAIRISSVLIGNLVSAARIIGSVRPSSVLVGNLVSAFKSWGILKTASVLVGNLASATVASGVYRAGSVLVGNLVSAFARKQNFPQVASLTGLASATFGAHNVYYPAGIQEGDLLLVFYAGGSGGAISFPGGWTQLFQTLGGLEMRFGAWYQIADGTEEGTFIVSVGTDCAVCYHFYRITDYLGVPEVGTAATALSTVPNPPSLTPSWGAKDTLWIAGEANKDEATVSNYPADYTNGRNDVNDPDGANCGVGTARRELNAISEDPGVFTLSESKLWVANTVAIKPLGRSYIRIASVAIGLLPTASKVGSFTRTVSVLVGNLVTASRVVSFSKDASVLVGNLTSASRAIAVTRLSSVLIGNLVTAAKSWNKTILSSVLIGNLVSALVALATEKSSLVRIGNLASASRTLATTRDSLVRVGNLVSAIRIRGAVRASLVTVGNLVSASRAIVTTRISSVLIGNLVSATRILGAAKTSAVLIGNLVSATVAWGVYRASLVFLGNLVSASRIRGSIRTSLVLVGVLVSASRLLGIIRVSSVLMGNLVSASRTWSVPVASLVLVGVLASASGIRGAVRTSFVLMGILVSATVASGVSRASAVLVGNLVSATRIRGAVRKASTLTGNLVSASSLPGTLRAALVLIGILASSLPDGVGVIRKATVRIGVLASASRAITTTRLSLVNIGNLVSASGSQSKARESLVRVGNLVTASRTVSYIRSAITRIGVLVSAFARIFGPPITVTLNFGPATDVGLSFEADLDVGLSFDEYLDVLFDIEGGGNETL